MGLIFGSGYKFTKIFSFFRDTTTKFSGIPLQPMYEPKRTSRFLINFRNIDEIFISSISKPKYSEKWEDIIIELYDPIHPSMSQYLYNSLPKKRSIFTRGPLFSFNIKSLDVTGVVIEDWLINVKRIKLIDFGELSYENDDIQTIKIVVEPLNCILNF